MPPHCDTMDGPVVKTAQKALKQENVNLVLPWVPKEAEEELQKAFEKTLRVRKLSDEARELVDYWFFETAVRLHREGEGEPYTGLKPAGLDHGPVVPKAEKAIEKEDPNKVINFLSQTIAKALQERFDRAMSKKNYDQDNVDAARDYIEAMLDFVLFSHHLYTYMKGEEKHKNQKIGEHQH